MLQDLWKEKTDWDQPITQAICNVWQRWYEELPLLQEHLIPCNYSPKNIDVASVELHGFSNTSELAYAGMVYLRTLGIKNCVHVSLVIARTKFALLKRLIIPQLELCGAMVMAKFLRHCQQIFDVPNESTFAWTDSTIVLSWLRGDSSRFKPFVGSRVTEIMDLLPPSRWRHVTGTSNLADCTSRGLYLSELSKYDAWWEGPE